MRLQIWTEMCGGKHTEQSAARWWKYFVKLLSIWSNFLFNAAIEPSGFAAASLAVAFACVRPGIFKVHLFICVQSS